MDRPIYSNAPHQWGSDALSDFFDQSTWNAWATFHGRRDWYDTILRVDSAFWTLANNLTDPPHIVAAFFVGRCHSVFRASARLAIATQVPESYALLRSVLEYAAYGLLLERSPELTAVWLQRNDDAKAKAKARNSITWGVARTAAKSADASGKIGKVLTDLYDRCVSYGAHPNGDAVFSNMRMTRSATHGTAFTIAYLSKDADSINLGLKTTVQVGFAALRVWQLVYPLKFKLLLLDDELDAIGSSGI